MSNGIDAVLSRVQATGIDSKLDPPASTAEL